MTLSRNQEPNAYLTEPPGCPDRWSLRLGLLQNLPGGHVPSFRGHRWNRHTEQLAEPPHCCPGLCSEGKSKGSPKSCLFLGTQCAESSPALQRDCRAQGHHRGLGKCQGGGPLHAPLNSPVGPTSWKTTVGCHKLSQVVTPLWLPRPVWTYRLNKRTHPLGGCVLLICTMPFCPAPSGTPQKQWLLDRTPSPPGFGGASPSSQPP